MTAEQIAEVLAAHRYYYNMGDHGCDCRVRFTARSEHDAHVAAVLTDALALSPEPQGCDCAELCAMGPTCPGGMVARLPGSGCWRTSEARP